MDKESIDRLKTSLAANAHDAWSRWTTHLLNQCSANEDGSLTIPASSVQRWERQIATPYDRLTDQEQASDLAEAELILRVFARSKGAATDATLL